MKVVIHLRRRGPAAGANALNFFQRKQTVRRSFLVSDAQLLLAMLEQFLAPAQHAGDVGANLHVVLAARLGGQHGVVADHVAHFELGQLQPRGNLLE